MTELIKKIYYSPEEIATISLALKHMTYSLPGGRRPDDSKIDFLISELQRNSLPAQAVKKGIQAIIGGGIEKEPSLKKLLEVCVKFVSQGNKQGCEKCSYSGYITLVKEKYSHPYAYGFACDCSLGKTQLFNPAGQNYKDGSPCTNQVSDYRIGLSDGFKYSENMDLAIDANDKQKTEQLVFA